MLKKLVLSDLEKKELADYGRVYIKRGGFNITVGETGQYDDTNYIIYVSNHYDNTSIDKQMNDYYYNYYQKNK